MLTRIRKAMDEREGGFTLIELLVVIIIIGILAAIAIPVFLNQRQKGYDAQAKSDLKNGATAEETWLTDNNVYTANNADLTAVGWKKSANDKTFVATPTGSTSYLLKATSDSGKSFCYDSSNSGAGVYRRWGCQRAARPRKRTPVVRRGRKAKEPAGAQLVSLAASAGTSLPGGPRGTHPPVVAHHRS
jgi:type IV pilus assembly protein PilA